LAVTAPLGRQRLAVYALVEGAETSLVFRVAQTVSVHTVVKDEQAVAPVVDVQAVKAMSR
jgi:hypothetical protein